MMDDSAGCRKRHRPKKLELVQNAGESDTILLSQGGHRRSKWISRALLGKIFTSRPRRPDRKSRSSSLLERTQPPRNRVMMDEALGIKAACSRIQREFRHHDIRARISCRKVLATLTSSQHHTRNGFLCRRQSPLCANLLGR